MPTLQQPTSAAPDQQVAGPVFILSVEESRAVLRQPEPAARPGEDHRRLAAQLVRAFDNKQSSGQARGYVVAGDGTLYGVFRSPQAQVGFVVPPDAQLSSGTLATPGGFEKYRARLQELLPPITTTQEPELRATLQEARLLAAAHLRGIRFSRDVLRDTLLRRGDTAGDIEFFAPTAGERPAQVVERTASPNGDPEFPPEEEGNAVVRDLLASYADEALSHTSYAEEHPLPSRKKVVRITDAFLPVLFPGYHGPRPTSKRFEAYLFRHVSWIRESLAEQITRALQFKYGADQPDDHYRLWGEQKTDALLAALPKLRRLLDQDVAAALDADPAVFDHHEIVVSYPGIRAIGVHRIAHELEMMRVPLIPRMMSEHAHSKTGIDIHPGARIGPGFFIDHGTGVVIGATAEIGRNVTLYQGVTLGALHFDRNDRGELIRGTKRHPTLEDHVVVYANAAVLGGETVVGRNSAIGANVWLPYKVPPEKIVLAEERKLRIRTKGEKARGKRYHQDASDGSHI